MKELTSEQITFLKSQNIDIRLVFNANGLKKDEYSSIMKDFNKIVAYNVTPCKAHGHTLRTRSGHCCQCNTATLAFQMRADSKGITYLAASLNAKCIKVGFTTKVSVRGASLNSSKYANQNDWKILFAIESPVAGQIENMANQKLFKYKNNLDYFHDNHSQEANEIFFYSYSFARQIILDICQDNSFKYDTVVDIKSNDYEFQKLIKK